jgi:ribosomal protein L4
MTKITVIFRGKAGDKRDHECAAIFKKHSGTCNGGGTYLGEKPERDLDYSVPYSKAEACMDELRAAGFSPDVELEDGEG